VIREAVQKDNSISRFNGRARVFNNYRGNGITFFKDKHVMMSIQNLRYCPLVARARKD